MSPGPRSSFPIPTIETSSAPLGSRPERSLQRWHSRDGTDLCSQSLEVSHVCAGEGRITEWRPSVRVRTGTRAAVSHCALDPGSFLLPTNLLCSQSCAQPGSPTTPEPGICHPFRNAEQGNEKRVLVQEKFLLFFFLFLLIGFSVSCSSHASLGWGIRVCAKRKGDGVCPSLDSSTVALDPSHEHSWTPPALANPWSWSLCLAVSHL